jgi:hypothetical protein
MPADDALLFIDANKYLDLYEIRDGKKLLAQLVEQVDHIFVTQQVVHEVQRMKIQVAVRYFTDKLKTLSLERIKVQDHLSETRAGLREEIRGRMEEIDQNIDKVNREEKALAVDILEQISRSEDEVSKALAPIFAKAVSHSEGELRRARERKEFGNPPGKKGSPLGDQLTWEQILTHFKGKKRLWIISRDSDYGTKYGGKLFLNGFLFEELCEVTPAAEVHFFEKTAEGIEDFVEKTGVKAVQQLTPEEKKELKEQEQSLPPLGWMSGMASGWVPGRPAGGHPAFYAYEFGDNQPGYQQSTMSPRWNYLSSSEMPFPPPTPPIDPKQTRGG